MEEREENGKARKEAQEAFTREKGAEIAADSEYLLKEIVERRAILRKGGRPLKFGTFDRETIARLLNSEAEIKFTAGEWGPDEDIEDEEERENPDTFVLWTYTVHEPAKEAQARWECIQEYAKYLYELAARAKSVKSDSMRTFLKAWLMVTGKGFKGVEAESIVKRLGAENAMAVVNMEAEASELLGLDILAAELPEFKCEKE